MGSDCHKNYIHMTTDGIADHSGSGASSKSDTSNVSSSANAAYSNPNTGSESPIEAEIAVMICAVTVFASRKRKHMR